MGWPRDPLLDTHVDNARYHVVRRIGSGGFGVVYQVHHTVLGTDRAMKVLAAHLASDPGITAAFVEEARLLHGLEHPHIVRCYDAGQLAATGQPFMLMELLHGRDLATVVAPPHTGTISPLPPRRVTHMGLQLALALVAAHRHKHGLLHRDIKPPNVFLLDEAEVGAHDHVKLIDFGIAKVLGDAAEQRRTLRIIGTPDYMAPEQFQPGRPLDARLDIWQLGAVLYFALIGTPPYALDTFQHQQDPLAIYRLQTEPHRRHQGPRPSERNPALALQAPFLDDLVARMLASDPDARPGSAAEVVAAFRTFLADPDGYEPEELEELTHRPTVEVPANPWSDTVDFSAHPAATPPAAAAPWPHTPQPAAHTPEPPPHASQSTEILARQRARTFSAAVPLKRSSRQLRARSGAYSAADLPTPPDLGSARPLSSTGRFSGRNRTAAQVRPILHVELIWPGRFDMGASWDEPGRSGDELFHHVELSRPFLIANTPVTRAQWSEVIGHDGHDRRLHDLDHPHTAISWFDAVAFANALSILEGREPSYALYGVRGRPGVDLTIEQVAFMGLDSPGYRLPTEAEWEFAARAGVTRRRYGPLDAIAWFNENSHGTTHPVAQRLPNAWGLFDALGNVWEWSHDWYGPYPDGQLTDPVGPDLGFRRVVRGGSFNSFPDDVRAATRHSAEPTYTADDLGFRLVRTMGSHR